MLDRKTAEAAIRSWVDEESEFRFRKLKRKPQPKLSLQEMENNHKKIIRVNTRLFRKFKQAGGDHL